MPYTKEKSSSVIEVEVINPQFKDEKFIFYLSKNLSKEAREAHAAYFGLQRDEREDIERAQLINAICESMVKEPSNFADFPIDERPLAERAREYFDDAERQELDRILFSVWRVYMSALLPQAYLKSLQDNDAGSSQLSAATSEA
jgi:hypothetical protein